VNRYAIYEENMERVRKKVARIQNKCRKYGCDFHFEEVGEEYRDIQLSDCDRPVKRRFVIVEAEGVAEINGWKFVASVEHTDKGNIISKACDVEVPSEYYTTTPICEHCRSRRYRKDTFIVVNTETGEFKQVGRSCLCDYTHGMSAEAVAAYAAMFDDLITAEAPLPGCKMTQYYDTKEVLQYAAETIRHFGYVKADESGRSTKERFTEYYGADHGWYRSCKQLTEWQHEMEDCGFDADSSEAFKMTDEALEWLAVQDESSNYIHNLMTVCALEACETKHFGLLASLFAAYSKAVEKEYVRRKEAEKEAVSEWVGEIGKRLTVDVESITALTSWETQWGTTVLYKITDKDGNMYVWKTSCYVPDNVVRIVGTVKAHNEYNDRKQTELTRCKVEEAKKDDPAQEGMFDCAEVFKMFDEYAAEA